MSFGISTCKGYHGDAPIGSLHEKSSCFRVLTCYTPKIDTIGITPTSLVNHPGQARCVVNTNKFLASIPRGAIIDMIEYNGMNSFICKGEFDIGIGQHNHTIMIPLIDGGTSRIANENVGGCRQFVAEHETGETNKARIPYDSCVNISCSGGVQSGSLRVDIYYHIKH